MDSSTVSILWHRRSKPQGKVRRRVQDLRLPSTHGPTLDLSHNESSRLAADCLLSQGLEGYLQMLETEAEVDFLSEQEKIYILKNGTDGIPHSDAGEDGELERWSGASQCTTQGSAASSDSGLSGTPVDLGSLKGGRGSAGVLDEPQVEVFFQSDSRAAGMKDVVREFIRRTTTALAVVTDSFSDVELLCDLLEASRKRNVSVHLLLDHLNLGLFLSMWDGLNLNSKDFPKLSVHSVDGQTYFAKTGRKLTGQIAENFLICDWTEVLTGSFSFSWLSWQVHRNLAVVVKGSAVTPFHQEFYRLYSSAKPVPGFVTYVSLPQPLALKVALHAAREVNAVVSQLKPRQNETACHVSRDLEAGNTQTDAKAPVLSNPKNPELEQNRGRTQPPELEQNRGRTQPPVRAGTGPQMYPPCLGSSEGGPKHSFGVAGRQTGVEPLEKNQSHVSHLPSRLTLLTINPTAKRTGWVHESNLLHAASQHRVARCPSPFKPHSYFMNKHEGAGGLFFQRRSRERLAKPLSTAAGPHTQRNRWYCSLHFKPNENFLSDHPRVPPPSTSRQREAQTGLPFRLTRTGEHLTGLKTMIGMKTAGQQQNHQQQQPLRSTEAPGSKPTSSATNIHPNHHLQPGINLNTQPLPPQQAKPPPRLNWIPLSPTPGCRLLSRHSSFSASYGRGQQRPFHSGLNASLRRGKS